jgi:hypothetical protein
VNKQCEIAVMLAYDLFGALRPNEHESTWPLQHEYVLQEEAAEAARLQYVVAGESHFE